MKVTREFADFIMLLLATGFVWAPFVWPKHDEPGWMIVAIAIGFVWSLRVANRR